MLQKKSLYWRATAVRSIEVMHTFLRQMSKNTKARFALNMSNFYLASELPRGENCHILAVDVLPFWGNPSQAKQEG